MAACGWVPPETRARRGDERREGPQRRKDRSTTRTSKCLSPGDLNSYARGRVPNEVMSVMTPPASSTRVPARRRMSASCALGVADLTMTMSS